MEQYEVTSIPDAPNRIIGAFFGNIRDYLKLEAKPIDKFKSEFSIGAFDEELRALHRLSGERTQGGFDDRRFSIELQSSNDIDLRAQKPMAVVCPDEYLDDKDFRDHIVDKWGALPISYPIVNLSVEHYYSVIYTKVYEFFKNNGVI